MNKDLMIWGREFSLEVAYDYFDEPIPQIMTEALEDLVSNQNSFDDALPLVTQYCLENDRDEIQKISRTDGIDNIFRYVMPQSLYVLEPETERKVMHRVALMCDYRFDPEEGLAVLFEDEKPTAILPHSSVM